MKTDELWKRINSCNRGKIKVSKKGKMMMLTVSINKSIKYWGHKIFCKKN